MTREQIITRIKHNSMYQDDRETAEYIIQALEEHKQGRWVSRGRPQGASAVGYTEYECSLCGRIIISKYGNILVTKDYPFCHCGADMRGSENG